MDTEKSIRSKHTNPVEPLGIFGVVAMQRAFEQLRDKLQALTEALPKEERGAIARYLRDSAIVFPIMEHTRDILGKAFGVPGGSGILTDGTYYWRRDAADYVEHYGIALPDDFLRHGRALQWVPPSMAEADVLRIHDYLLKHVRTIRVDRTGAND